MSTIYDDIPFGSKLAEPRDLNSRRYRHVLLAILCSLLAAATWFAPLPVDAGIKPFLAIVVGFLPFAGIAAFRAQFLLCLLFIGFAFFRFHEVYPPLRPLRIPLLLSLAVLGVLSYNLMLSRRIKTYWEAEFTPFILFVIWGVASMFMAVNFENSKDYFVDTFSKIIIMTFAIAWIVRRPEQFLFVTRFFVCAGIIVGTVAIYNKLMGIGLVEGTRVTIARHLRSPLGDPNDLSLVLMFPLSFATALIMIPKSYWQKLLGATGTVVMIWAIIATQSRGGLLGLLAVLGVVGQRYIKSKLVLGGIGGIAAVSLAAMAGLSNRSSSSSYDEGLDESAQARLDTWETAWNMAVANPYFGVGWENFYSQYGLYAENWKGTAHVVHSTWFGVLTDTGFPGFFMFLTMVILIVWRCLRNSKLLAYRRAPEGVRCVALAVLAGVAGVCISGTFLTQGFTWPIYILTALAVATSRFTKEYKIETQKKADDGWYDRPEPPPLTLKQDPNYLWGTRKANVSKAVWNPDRDLPKEQRTSRR